MGLERTKLLEEQKVGAHYPAKLRDSLRGTRLGDLKASNIYEAAALSHTCDKLYFTQIKIFPFLRQAFPHVTGKETAAQADKWLA